MIKKVEYEFEDENDDMEYDKYEKEEHYRWYYGKNKLEDEEMKDIMEEEEEYKWVIREWEDE